MRGDVFSLQGCFLLMTKMRPHCFFGLMFREISLLWIHYPCSKIQSMSDGPMANMGLQAWATIKDGDRTEVLGSARSYDMDNLSIFRANCSTLTTYIFTVPRICRGFSRGYCHVGWSRNKGMGTLKCLNAAVFKYIQRVFRCVMKKAINLQHMWNLEWSNVELL